MDGWPQISIIVPVYNVEIYLRKCLDSLCDQTYSNFEIILVDDGSTDRSGIICDEYARKDVRIRVIHQENQGLSAARNTGISHAAGAYLGFVDSDDWVESGMFQALMEAARNHEAEIAACQFRYVFPDGREEVRPAREFAVCGREAVKMLLEGEQIQDYVCNKLISARLFTEIRFPVGQAFEDISTTYRLFLKASRVASIPQALYCYYQRATGIVHSGSLKNEMDCYCAKYRRYKELSSLFPDSVFAMMGGMGQSAVKVWWAAWKAGRAERACCSSQLAAISDFVRKHYPVLRESSRLGRTGRMTLALARFPGIWSYALGGLLCWLYRCNKG